MFVLPKGKYKNQEMKDYEEKSFMYGIGSDYADNTNSIGGTLAMASE